MRTCAFMAILAIVALSTSTASAKPSSASYKNGKFNAHIDFCLHFNPWAGKFYIGPCKESSGGGGGCNPDKRALVVLLENGGFPASMPVDATITIKTCDYSNWKCMFPSNWSYKTYSITDYISNFITGASDFALEAVGVGMVWASNPLAVYDDVIILEDGDFDQDEILDTLESLTCDYVVDVHVLAHGSNGCAGPGCAINDDFLAEVGDLDDLHLGAVYQQNCFGASLNSDWIDAGAVAVNGSVGINYMPSSYASFIDRWTDGQTFSQACNGAFSDWEDAYDFLYGFVDLYYGNTKRNKPLISLTGSLSANDELSASADDIDGDPNTTVSDLN